MFYVQKKYKKLEALFVSVSCFLLLASCFLFSCAKTYRVATPTQPKYYKQAFAASPNDVYYALRWAFRTHGYPIAEEDLQNGVIKTRYAPVKANSHFLNTFDRKDFGINGAYHQLEARLAAKNGKTEVQLGSRIQSVVANLQSSGAEEKMILQKVADYLRSPNVQITNLGVQE